MNYELRFLFSLVLTIVIELTVLYLLIRYLYKIKKDRIPNSILIFAGVFDTFATLPYVWFILPKLILNYNLYIVTAEVLVFLIEAIFYFFIFKIDIKKALVISFVCNLITTIVGLLINNVYY